MGAEEWIGQSEQNETDWTDVEDGAGVVFRRAITAAGLPARQLLVTFLCVDAPALGELSVRILHSSDYGLTGRSTKHWKVLHTFNGVQAGSSADEKLQFAPFGSFNEYIKVESKCSEADQAVSFNVDIDWRA